MSGQILEYLEQSSAVITPFAVVVIIVGFVLVAGRYARRWRGVTLDLNFKQFKIDRDTILFLFDFSSKGDSLPFGFGEGHALG